MKLCAVLMAVWYLMSIIGFNVHTCHTAHHHSHVEEHHCGCCHDECPESEVSFSCCSDDYHVLDLPGLVSSNENGIEDTVSADMLLFAGYVSHVCILSDGFKIHKIRSLPDSGRIASQDVQSVLGIWRI